MRKNSSALRYKYCRLQLLPHTVHPTQTTCQPIVSTILLRIRTGFFLEMRDFVAVVLCVLCALQLCLATCAEYTLEGVEAQICSYLDQNHNSTLSSQPSGCDLAVCMQLTESLRHYLVLIAASRRV